MPFIIRDKIESINRITPRYRGVFRPEPRYVATAGSESEVIRTFERYLHESDELGAFGDAAVPMSIAAVYNKALGRDQFEVLEIVQGDAGPIEGSGFLGFDLASKLHLSHIAASVDREIHRGNESKVQRVGPASRTFVIGDLLVACFRPQLNEHRLFGQREVAAFCLESIDAIQLLWPGFFEDGEFDIVGIWVMGAAA